MNFDEAIAAHSAWKQKLIEYLLKPDKSIDPVKLAKDDQCELGKWIYANSAQYASDASFQSLKQDHAEFHKAAADVVKRADEGKRVSQEIALGATSPYAQRSANVVKALIRMKLNQAA